MPNIELTVGKKFTINTQNFSSVSPTFTIKLNGIEDLEKVNEVHELLELIADGLWHKQMINDIKSMATLKSMGVGKYVEELEKNDIDGSINDALKKLIDI